MTIFSVPKISCRESAEVAKTVFQERISERSQVIEVPEISCQKSVQVAKTVLQEQSPERRCEQSEVIKMTETSSQDQIWLRTVGAVLR